MSALTLMSYPFEGRPVYLALAPLTHAAGVLCFPILALGGRIVIMPKADLTEFLDLIERRRVTHTFLPPTLIYMLLENPRLAGTDRSSLQCFWYGAAPISVARLEEAIDKIGPVMAQLFGQTEAPMMISTMAPKDHFNPDGTVARGRLASAGRPTPLTQVGVMDEDGRLLPTEERGEIVVRGSLVMEGYYKSAQATAEVSRFNWHHTGDIGYLDEENFLYIVDRANDMIITGGFNVYSIEVEQALLQHPHVMESAVFGLPDAKWGERVAAVVQPHAGRVVTAEELIAFVKRRIGSVKAPKQVEVWPELPRSMLAAILILIAAAAIFWLIFFKFKLLRLTPGWGFIFALFMIHVMLVFMIGLRFVTPSSVNATMVQPTIQLIPRLTGPALVTAVLVQDNDRVKKGQPLFQFDRRPYEDQVAQMEAQLAAAKQNVSVLKADVDIAMEKTALTKWPRGHRSGQPGRRGARHGRAHRQAPARRDGGEWKVASCVVAELACAPKCRAADDLVMACEVHPAYARQRIELRGLPTRDLSKIACGPGPVHERALALWCALGGGSRSLGFRASPRRECRDTSDILDLVREDIPRLNEVRAEVIGRMCRGG